MSITTALTNQGKLDCLQGLHQPGHTYKCALIKATPAGTLDKTMQYYSDLGTDEVADGNGYTTGGVVLSNISFAITGDVASIDWDNATWPASTISADGCIIYNDSLANKNVLSVHAFAATVTSSNDLFTATIPETGVGVVRFG